MWSPAVVEADETSGPGIRSRNNKTPGSPGCPLLHALAGNVAGAKASTLRDRETALGEPGVQRRRGEGKTLGHVMAALGDRPAAKITTREINELLATISATGTSASTVNKYRSALSPSSTMAASRPRCAANESRRDWSRQAPGAAASSARVLHPDEIEAIARALAEARHRDPSYPAVNDSERVARQAEDRQDAEMVRVAAYAGLRQGRDAGLALA